MNKIVQRWQLLALSLLVIFGMMFTLLPLPIPFGGAGVASATATIEVITATPGGSIWTVPAGVIVVEVLVVAGGGGGSLGGGGAGGLVYNAAYTVTPLAELTCIIGTGGAGGNGANGTDGNESYFGSIHAHGGGGGGAVLTNGSGGGSGGGGGGHAGGTTTGGATTQDNSGGGTGYGYAGGGNAGKTASPYASGGGGGAGAVGGSATATGVCGNGGAGKDYSAQFGSDAPVPNSGLFAGGGGGANYSAGGTAGTASYGGGAGKTAAANGNAGTGNTGGGGGGARNGYTGGAGGSGVVILKYIPISTQTITTLAATSITISSAILNGNVTSLGDYGNITSYGFVLSNTTQSNPGNVSPSLQTTYTAGNWTWTGVQYAAGTTFTSQGNVTGLGIRTIYYFRPAGYSTYGWVYGSELSFSTLALPITDYVYKKQLTFNTLIPGAHQFIVDSTAHSDYGFSYPLTYKYSIPVGLASGGKAYHKHTIGAAWVQLTTKTTSDFFNGIEAVRFDYTSHFAYISVVFDSSTDDIFVEVTDASDVVQGTSFVEITAYYDNRTSAVVATLDVVGAYGNMSTEEYDAINMYQSKNIWLTGFICNVISPGQGGIPTTAEGWASIQTEVTGGYFEPGSITKSHTNVPYGDYEYEIAGSKADILGNLTMPALNTKGSTEYLYAFAEPGGSSDATARAQLAEHDYLCDRVATATGASSFAAWNADGLYSRLAPTIWMDNEAWGTTNVATLEASFDSTHSGGGIFLMCSHPKSNTWESSGYADQVTTYIGNRTDVWYTGFGHLYLYHYGVGRGKVSVSGNGIGITTNQSNFPVCVHINVSSWPDATENGNFFCGANTAGKRIQFYDSDQTTNLNYEVEYYNATGNTSTNEAIYWVGVPQVDGNSATDSIWVGFGNDPNSADQDRPTDVWNTNYKAVYHMADSATPLNDSTSDNWDLVKGGASAVTYQQTGKVGYSVLYPTSTALHSKASCNLGSSSYTVGFWVNVSTLQDYNLFVQNNGLPGFQFHTSAVGIVYAGSGDGGTRIITSAGYLTTSTWYYLTLELDSANGQYLYKNGNLTHSNANKPTPVWGTLQIGYDAASSAPYGYMDEVRVSNSVSSADWVQLEYYSMLKTNFSGDSWLSWGAAIFQGTPDISNTPSSWSVGVVQPSSVYSTGLGNFTLTNNSSFAVDVSISGTDMTGGTTWTLSDTATPASNVFGLRAGLNNTFTKVAKSTSGGNDGEGIVSLGEYLYTPLYESPAVVDKIRKSDMIVVGNWTAPSGYDICLSIVSDGEYIYTGIFDTTGHTTVFKINPSGMTTVGNFTSVGNDYISYDLAFDGEYIYTTAGGANWLTDPGYVIKINRTSLTEVSRWTGNATNEEHYPLALLYDAPYLYVSTDTALGRVVQIDVSTMTTEDVWEGDTRQVYGMYADETYMYMAIYENPAQVDKVDIATLTTVGSWVAEYEDDEQEACNIVSDGSYIYVVLNSNGSPLMARIDPDTMEKICNYDESVEEHQANSAYVEDGYLYLVLETSPAQVLKFDLHSIIVRKTSTFNYLTTSLAAGGNVTWGLELLTPTNDPFSDGVQKSGNVTLTAEAS